MANSSPLVRVVPRSALADFRALVAPPDTPATAAVELHITFSSKEVVARDLAAYLELIDRVYGRLEEGSLIRYAMRRSEHVRINQIRAGSVELIIQALSTNSAQVTSLVIAGFALKYLPEILRSAGAGYKDIQEGALLREQRRRLHEKARADRELSKLDDRRRRQLVALLDKLYELEARRIPSAGRFASRSVRRVEFAITSHERKKSSSEGDV